jgi:hypothetical protein
MEIKNKEDLDILIDSLLKGEVDIRDKYSLFLSLREGIKNFYLKRGDIPPSDYLRLYFSFRDLEVEKDEFISKNIETLNNYYDLASEEEKVLLNNVIFVLSVFNGEDYVKKFLKRGLFLNPYNFLNNREFQIFRDFCDEIDEEEIVLETVREYLNDFLNYGELDRKIFYANVLFVLWNSPLMHNNEKWMEISDDFVNLLNELIKKEMIEEQMYVHFLFYHLYGNNVKTIKEWEWFSEKVEKPASEFYKKWGEKKNLPKCKLQTSKKRKKIGFLVDRIVLNSPFMVLFSLIESLTKNEEFKENYDLFVFSMSYVEKQNDDEKWVENLKKLGCEVVLCEKFLEEGFFVSHLKKALWIRDKILENEIDYLIGSFGYDISNFIFSNRSAPKQIFWSHGNCASKIENVDLKISHFTQECDGEWKIFDLVTSEMFLKGSRESKTKGELIKKSLLESFGKNTVFLGTIGRLVKIDGDDYLKAVSEILNKNPNAVYLACGSGNTESIKEKLKKYDIPEERFVFTGVIDKHIFGWVIDVWLDTFPLRQGQSLVEAQAKGGAIVHYAPVLPEKDAENIKKAYEEGEKDLGIKLPFYPIAETVDEYIDYADKLIKDEKLRKEIGESFRNSLLKLLKKPNIEGFLKVLNES